MPAMKELLAPILPVVNWSSIARDYFGHTRSWLYQKMSGIDVNKNGRPFDFNEQEREKLRAALMDVADRIRAAAEKI